MEGKSRTTLNYLDQLQQFHLQNGNPLTRLPTLDRKPIDLFKLKKEVARRGGHEAVGVAVWTVIGFVQADSMTTTRSPRRKNGQK